jgi:tetraacyldisaccharide-1-P 4'-kinase
MERVWFGRDAVSRAARAALMPVERVFAGVSGLRTLLYDAGWVKGTLPPVPVVSVGNLTVGGTGKTPVSAWIARWLRDHGGHPAIVMRGYGDDEPAVHRLLNPDVDVIVAPDRARGVEEAVRRGADIAVLDDGFQHRQLRRDVDIVLISADQWPDDVHLLPPGRSVRRQRTPDGLQGSSPLYARRCHANRGGKPRIGSRGMHPQGRRQAAGFVASRGSLPVVCFSARERRTWRGRNRAVARYGASHTGHA